MRTRLGASTVRRDRRTSGPTLKLCQETVQGSSAAAGSDEEVPRPYTPGAAAFVAYDGQNDAFTVVEATPLTIDGHDAIHLVPRSRWTAHVVHPRTSTPRRQKTACATSSAASSLYPVDFGADTYLFQLSPTAARRRRCRW